MVRRIHSLLLAFALAFMGASAHADFALERTNFRGSSVPPSDVTTDGRWSLLDVFSLFPGAQPRRGDCLRRLSERQNNTSPLVAGPLALFTLPALPVPPAEITAAPARAVSSPTLGVVSSSRTSRGPPARN